jgi:hypothetical protein
MICALAAFDAASSRAGTSRGPSWPLSATTISAQPSPSRSTRMGQSAIASEVVALPKKMRRASARWRRPGLSDRAPEFGHLASKRAELTVGLAPEIDNRGAVKVDHIDMAQPSAVVSCPGVPWNPVRGRAVKELNRASHRRRLRWRNRSCKRRTGPKARIARDRRREDGRQSTGRSAR